MVIMRRCGYCGKHVKHITLHRAMAHGTHLNLVEVFTEHVPIIKGGSQYGRYDAEYELARTDGRLELDKLREYVKHLNEKYPDQKFYVKKQGYRRKTLYVLAKPKKVAEMDESKKRIPIYFNIEGQKIYVKREDLQQQTKLVNYVLMRVLGALGLAKVQYLGIAGRA
jgi:hypothetical protein